MMTSITWAGSKCVQEPAAILAPQKRTQGRCEALTHWYVDMKLGWLYANQPAFKLREGLFQALQHTLSTHLSGLLCSW